MTYYLQNPHASGCCPDRFANIRVVRASDLVQTGSAMVLDNDGGTGGTVYNVRDCGAGGFAVLLESPAEGFNPAVLDTIVVFDSDWVEQWRLQLEAASWVPSSLHPIGEDSIVVYENSGAGYYTVRCYAADDGTLEWSYQFQNMAYGVTANPDFEPYWDAANSLLLCPHYWYVRASDSKHVNITAFNATGTLQWQANLSGATGGGGPSPQTFFMFVPDGSGGGYCSNSLSSTGSPPGAQDGFIAAVDTGSYTYPFTDGDQVTLLAPDLTTRPAHLPTMRDTFSAVGATDVLTLTNFTDIGDEIPVHFPDSGGLSQSPPANINVAGSLGAPYIAEAGVGASFTLRDQDGDSVDIVADFAPGTSPATCQQWVGPFARIFKVGTRWYYSSQAGNTGRQLVGWLVRALSTQSGCDLSNGHAENRSGPATTIQAYAARDPSSGRWAYPHIVDQQHVRICDASLDTLDDWEYPGYEDSPVGDPETRSDERVWCVHAISGYFIFGGETTRRKLEITDT